MTLRYYLGDLQGMLDLLNECRWGPEKRKIQRRHFNQCRRRTFEREEIVCGNCDALCELWGEVPDTRTRSINLFDEKETFRVLTAFCTTCEDFPEAMRFEELV